MTQRKALGDLDFDYAFDDPDNGWFGGHTRAAEPTSSREVDDLPRDDHSQDVGSDGADDTDRWYVSTPTPASWESRLSSSSAWDFKVSTSGPWYHSKYVVASMIVAAVAVAGVLLLLMRSPGPAVEESTTVSPNESTAGPAPTSTGPALSTASDAPLPPGPPPGPPPPPPSSAEEISPPVVNRDYTPRRQTSPDESDKPEIGVTRTPTTRSQLSATPPPPPAPDRNSSTPGDGRKRGNFGW